MLKNLTVCALAAVLAIFSDGDPAGAGGSGGSLSHHSAERSSERARAELRRDRGRRDGNLVESGRARLRQ